MPADPLVSLVRRWSVDWLNGQHPEVCEEILAPEYNLLIGGFRLGPREEYVRATLAQLSRYPGLVVTTHHLVSSGDQVAVVFSEHGASIRLDGRQAVWTGVAVFGWNGSALTECFAEEDYYARRRQLDSATCDPVGPPAVAPWDAVPRPRNEEAEQVVRSWLSGPDLRAASVECDDETVGQPARRLLDVETCRFDALFSAGDEVAFHVAQTGRYVGGLDGLDHRVGETAQMEMAGIVTVRAGRVVGGKVVRDRLGTARALEAAATVP